MIFYIELNYCWIIRLFLNITKTAWHCTNGFVKRFFIGKGKPLRYSRRRHTRKKVVATAKHRERVYKWAVEPSVPFCEKGGTTARVTDFSVKKIGTEQSPFRRGCRGRIWTTDLRVMRCHFFILCNLEKPRKPLCYAISWNLLIVAFRNFGWFFE